MRERETVITIGRQIANRRSSEYHFDVRIAALSGFAHEVHVVSEYCESG